MAGMYDLDVNGFGVVWFADLVKSSPETGTEPEPKALCELPGTQWEQADSPPFPRSPESPPDDSSETCPS